MTVYSSLAILVLETPINSVSSPSVILKSVLPKDKCVEIMVSTIIISYYYRLKVGQRIGLNPGLFLLKLDALVMHNFFEDLNVFRLYPLF